MALTTRAHDARPPIRHRRAVAFAVVALAGSAPLARVAAQRVPESRPSALSVRAGDTLRVWAPSLRLAGRVGQLAGLRGDTLLLVPRAPAWRPALDAGTPVDLRAVTRLEVQRGYRRSSLRAAVGLVLGLAGGAVVGSLAGVTLECGTSCSDEQSELAGLAGFVVGGTIGALAGAVTGTVIGARRRSRWEPVALPAR